MKVYKYPSHGWGGGGVQEGGGGGRASGGGGGGRGVRKGSSNVVHNAPLFLAMWAR